MVAELRDQPALCVHCTRPIPGDRDQPGERFCCRGCEQVYHLLHDWGLDDFYRQRARGGTLRDPLPGEPAPTASGPAATDEAYTGPAFEAAFVHRREDGLGEIDWQVTGLHCSACVWLLESLPRLDGGIRSARVAFGSGRLSVVFDPERCPPARQARLIGALGYRPRPWGDRAADDAARRDLRSWLLRFVVAGASAASAMHLAVALFAGHHGGDMDVGTTRTFGLAALAVALPALTYGAWPYYRSALAGFRVRRPVIEQSIALVIVTGLALGAWNAWRGRPEVYVDALAMFVAFLAGGRLALVAARQRLAGHGSLHGLLPTEARRIAGSDTTRVLATDLLPGDRIRIRAGDAVPADGQILAGAGRIDLAVLTGEPRPVSVAADDRIHAGCRLLEGELEVSVSAAGSDTRMGRLLDAVREGAWRPTATTRVIDRLQRAYAPVVAGLAVAAWAWWRMIEPARALDQTMALILACCPCALGLATPLVYALAVKRSAARGILLRDGGAIEDLAAARHVVLDKTGTCTSGRFTLVAWHWLAAAPRDERTRHAIQAAVHAAEARARHPVAAAIVDWCRGQDIEAAPIADWDEIPGRGLRCAAGPGDLRIGSPAWIGTPAAAAAPIQSVAVALDGQPVARLDLRDPLRDDAAAVVAACRAHGATVHLLSGDDHATTQRVAAEIGIDAANAHGGRSPEAKAETVAALAADGPTLMVGDGVNDRLALDAAQVGIGVRGGLEAAVSGCTAYAANDGLGDLPELLRGARAATRTLHRALGWSLVYNLVAVIAVFAGVWGPYVCAAAMPSSSLLTILLVTRGRFMRGERRRAHG